MFITKHDCLFLSVSAWSTEGHVCCVNFLETAKDLSGLT